MVAAAVTPASSQSTFRGSVKAGRDSSQAVMRVAAPPAQRLISPMMAPAWPTLR